MLFVKSTNQLNNVIEKIKSIKSIEKLIGIMTYINKKYLGLDYGSVRIGVSISDELGILARPFMV